MSAFRGRVDIIKDIQEKADTECDCTPAQETGKDPTLCMSCRAAQVLNDVSQCVRMGARELGIEVEAFK